MGPRVRLRRLEKATKRETISFLLEDGTTARFYEDEVWPRSFLRETSGRRTYKGKMSCVGDQSREAIWPGSRYRRHGSESR